MKQQNGEMLEFLFIWDIFLCYPFYLFIIFFFSYNFFINIEIEKNEEQQIIVDKSEQFVVSEETIEEITSNYN